MAADVGIDWYTWLEQGRNINPSAAALTRIARALKLSLSDEVYLFSLAGVLRPQRSSLGNFEPSAALHSVMASYRGPVAVLDPLFEILAYNSFLARFYRLDQSVGPYFTNQLWQLFMNPFRRTLYVDFPADAMNFVALFRVTAAPHVESPTYRSLLTALLDASADFAAMWNEQQTARREPRAVRMTHPDLGELSLQATRFLFEDMQGSTIVFLGPADPASAAAFAAFEC